MEMNRAVSQPDLEEKLQTVDKSTIFRTISLFLDRHLIHAIDDGSGALKYAVCSDRLHLFGERPARTFLLRRMPSRFLLPEPGGVPVVQAPEGFVLHGVNYVLKGLCPACAARPDRD